ncbi:potassium channel KOR1-like [Macadamia integrifolia]|uniref:potassium channel KOR1-like n=1 Tax=Macadamia integrifolia TaxID=60698 RepID=UPI001C4FFA14|nr:potassium channel KOR1-like [Macadamia integrifolia]
MWNKVQAIFKILIVPFYIVHVLGCFMFYLATTYHPWGDTWIGSLKMGTYSYSDLKEIDLPRKYVTSLYWSAMTFTTIGFGDIHAVNIREMLAMTIFSLLGVFLQAYITNSMTMLFVIKRTEQQTSASEGAPPHWDDKLHQLTKTMQKLEETIGGLVEKLDQQVELRGSMDNREIQEQREQGDRGSNRHRQQFEINPVD